MIYIYLVFILIIYIMFMCIINNSSAVGLRYFSLFSSLCMLYYSIYVWLLYQSSGTFYYIFDILKFGNLYIYLGFDTLSLAFISLSTFLIPFCIFFGYKVGIGLSQYSILLLFLNIILVFIFLVMDILLFYILFESILIPLFILIGIFGSRHKKLHSAVLLYGYTVVGSFLMLIVLFYLYLSIGSSFYFDLWTLELSIYQEIVLFILLFISFSIKIPLFPFHIWLPEAHVEASTEGSVILAGVMLKLGGYAMLRFIIPIFYNASIIMLPILCVVCVLGMFYVSMVTLRQTDLKRIIAYSSIVHMSLVVVAIYVFNSYSLDGSIYVMLSHGLVSGSLFFCVGYMYEKYKTRQLYYYYDIVNTMPIFSAIFFFFILSNIAFPGLFSFIGELYMLVGILSATFWGVILTLPSLFITTVYSIGLYSRIIFGYSGVITSSFKINSDLNLLDLLFFLPFIGLIVIWGIYPPVLYISVL